MSSINDDLMSGGKLQAVLFSTDASGNVTGLVGPGGHTVSYIPLGPRIAIVGNSVTSQCVPNAGTTLTKWAPSTAKTVGNAVIPMSFKGVLYPLKYVCTVAGTTAAGYGNEPSWPTTLNETVQDGTVTWQAQSDGDLATNTSGDWWFWAQALSGFRVREVYMAGLSGQKMEAILQLEDAILASNPGYVLFASPFANDIWSGSAGTVANVLAAWNAFESALERFRLRGIVPIITSELPNGHIDSNGTSFTDYNSSRGGTKLWIWVNAKIREYAAAHSDSCIFVDFANIYRDTNPANPVWPDNSTTYTLNNGSTEKLTDAIHPTSSGAFVIAQKLAAVLEANFKAINHFQACGATYEVDPNPDNYGTTGTDGSGTTGDVATSLTMTPYGTGAAVTASKIARTDIVGHWNRGVYTATSGDNLDLTWNKAAASVGLSAGDVIESVAEIKVLASPTGFSRPELRNRFNGASPQWIYTGILPSNGVQIGQFLTSDTVFTLRTYPFKVPSGFTAANSYIKAYSIAGAASFTVDYGRHSMRRLNVADLS